MGAEEENKARGRGGPEKMRGERGEREEEALVNEER